MNREIMYVGFVLCVVAAIVAYLARSPWLMAFDIALCVVWAIHFHLLPEG